MKVKLFLIALGLCACTSVWAQSPRAKNRTSVKVVKTSELKEGSHQEGFLVDEEALQQALKKLAIELKASKNQKSKEQMQLLRYQMLIKLLRRRVIAPKEQVSFKDRPLVININNARQEKQIVPKQKHIEKPKVDTTTLLLEKRLAYLEARLKAVELKNAKKASVQQPIIVHQKASVEHHRIDSLERRLMMLTTESQKLDTMLVPPSDTILLEVDTVGAKDTVLMVDTVKLVQELVNTKEVSIPADFQREVFFAVNSTVLTPQAKSVLDDVLHFMREFPKSRFKISGYASADGSKVRNLRLAHHRQASVRTYLQERGISASHFVEGTPSIDKDVVAEPLGRKVVIKLIK